MIDPSFEPYLIEAIARTGVQRYRFLCYEHPDEKTRRQFQSLVIDIATGAYTGQRYDPNAPQADPCNCDGSSYPMIG